MDRVLNKSSCSGGALGLGIEASWGPQLESVKEVICLIGKWINV